MEIDFDKPSERELRFRADPQAYLDALIANGALKRAFIVTGMWDAEGVRYSSYKNVAAADLAGRTYELEWWGEVQVMFTDVVFDLTTRKGVPIKVPEPRASQVAEMETDELNEGRAAPTNGG